MPWPGYVAPIITSSQKSNLISEHLTGGEVIFPHVSYPKRSLPTETDPPIRHPSSLRLILPCLVLVLLCINRGLQYVCRKGGRDRPTAEEDMSFQPMDRFGPSSQPQPKGRGTLQAQSDCTPLYL